MVLSVVAMSGLSAVSVKAAASAGDLIKMSGNTSVYYLGADGKRYVFPNSTTYFSWYPDFSGVITIPSSELQSYPLGGNVTMRAGTKLVKITTDPSVYAVEPNGALRKIQSEAQASALYGTQWSKRVVDVPDAFFTNYTVGTALPSGAIAVGSLVKNASGSDVYYYDGSNYRLVANETAFNANKFQWANVITAASTVSAGGSSISGAETSLVNVAQSGTPVGPVVTGSGLMASLSASTPAVMNIPVGVAVDFLKLNLTAANDGAVNVNSIKLTATDLGSPSNLDDVTFYDNGVKVGTAKNVNSDGIAIFNFATPITVNAGTTKTLLVRVTAAAVGNYVLGISAAADIISSAASVTGSFPIKSNSLQAVTGAAVGDVILTNAGTNDTSNNFGEDNVLVASFDLNAHDEDILISSLKMKNGGTNDANLFSNAKIYIDGTEVATGSYSDAFLTFNMNNFVIEEGDTVSVEIKADLGTTNVNDTVNLYIKDKADFAFIGKTRGFSAPLDDTGFATLNAASDGIIVTFTAGDFTLDMDKSSASGTPAKDVKAGDTDVVLATLIMQSNSENATVEQIVGTSTTQFDIEGTGLTAEEIKNVELVDVATGAIYDVTESFNTNRFNLSMTDEISLTKGVAKKFLLRADMEDATNLTIDEGNTLKVVLDKEAMTITGDVSDASITDVTPGEVSSAITTIASASLTWTPVSSTDKTVVGGAVDVVLYQASLKAGTADSIKLQSVKLGTAATSSAFADTNVTKLDLYLNGQLLKSVAGDISESTTASSTITFQSLNTNFYTIAAGATVDLVVKGSFASSLTGTGVAFSLIAVEGDITSRSVDGNVLVVETGTIGAQSRSVTLQSVGTLKVDMVTTDSKADQDSWVLAGSESASDRYLGELKFTTENEAVKVTKLVLNATSSSSASNDDLAQVKLYKMVNSVPTWVATSIVDAGGDVTFDPFDVVFPADQVTSLFISVVAKGMNVDGDASATADYNQFINYNIAEVEANGDNSGTAITMTEDTAGAAEDNEFSNVSLLSKTAYVVGSKLNSITNALSDGVLGGGADKIIGKYTLVFDNGNNRNAANEALKAILSTTTVTITKSTNVDIATAKMYIDGSAANTANATGDTGTSTTVLSWAPADLANLADGGKLDGSVTIVITATVTPSAADGEFLQTSIADLSGSSSDDDITFIGDGETASAALTNIYTPVASVNGGTLSE